MRFKMREAALFGALMCAVMLLGGCGDGVTHNCERRGDSVRAVPELSRGETSLRGNARELAGRFGKSRYCFTAPIDEIEKLLTWDGKKGAKARFPTLNYLDEERESPVSSASVVDDIRIPRFVVPATLTGARTNKELRDALAYHHEKVSGTKAEMLGRIAILCVKLYEKHERKLRKLFKGRYVRLSYTAADPGHCFETKLEPRSVKGTDASGNRIVDTPLRGTVISMFVMKHLRADRILDPAYENTAYGADDLARALLSRHVMLQGTFVKAV
ncbi:MAG: hypothetical protein ACYTKD_20995 [Planctomycetota bacterium]